MNITDNHYMVSSNAAHYSAYVRTCISITCTYMYMYVNHMYVYEVVESLPSIFGIHYPKDFHNNSDVSATIQLPPSLKAHSQMKVAV